MTAFEEFITELEAARPLLGQITYEQTRRMSGLTEQMIFVVWNVEYWFGEPEKQFERMLLLTNAEHKRYETWAPWFTSGTIVREGVTGWIAVGVL